MTSPRSSTSGILSELDKQSISFELLQSELSKELATEEKESLIKKFWHSLSVKGTPIFNENSAGDFTITFLYRSNDSVTVELDCNDLNEQKLGADGEVRFFQRIPGTDIYYFQVNNVPRDAILPYGFYVTDQDGQRIEMKDSLCKDKFHLPLCNLNTGETMLDQREASLLVMPEAKQLQSIERPSWCRDRSTEISKCGEMRDIIFDASEKGYGERKVWIYTPPEYDSDREIPYKLMLITDGGTYAMLMPPHLDVLSNVHSEINNIVVAFVGNVRQGSASYHPIDLTDEVTKDDTDHRQYEFMDHSEEFYSAVIAPILDKLRNDAELNLNVSKNPQDTILAGFSLGGHFAAEVGLNHADNIGNVICLSGAFNTSIKSLAAVLPDNHDHQIKLNLFMSVGRLEDLHQTPENQQVFHVTGDSRVEANQKFAEALSSNGFNVQLAPLLPSGHNELSTMHVLTDMALPFVCRPTVEIELSEDYSSKHSAKQ